MCKKQQQTVDFCKCVFSSSIQFESGFIVSTYCSIFSHCDRYFILQSDWPKKNYLRSIWIFMVKILKITLQYLQQITRFQERFVS